MTRLRNLIPTTAKLQLYKAAVLPYLTYCSTTWHFCSGSVTQGRWSVSRRGVLGQFSVTGTLTISRCWNGLICPTLMNCRLHDIAIIMYKVKFKLAPSYIQDLFSTNHIVYNLRVKEFAIPRFNSIHYDKHSLRYLEPVLWAKLPPRVRTLHSLAGFKRAVRGLDLEMLMDDSSRVCMVCNA